MHAMKSLPARITTKDDDEQGIVEAIVATYDVDSIGDKITPGAFSKSLDDWAQSGHSIPFIWSHQHDDLDAYLGDVLDAKETDDGLWVRAQLDMSDAKSAKAYRLLKSGRVHQYSFAYDVVDAEQADDVNELRELKLYEVGPCLIGMNQQTRTLAAKQHATTAAKRGRVLSSTNETDLRDALTAITRVLAQLDEASADDESSEAGEESSQSTEPEKRDERASVKRDEPTPSDALDDDLAAELLLATQKGASFT